MMRSMWMLLLAGCVTDAPEDIEDMLVYGFVHAVDERELSLRALSDNLIPWMDTNFEAAADGYGISRLTQEDLDEGGVDATLEGEGIVGAVAGLSYAVTLDQMAWGLTEPDQTQIFAAYLEYEAEVLEGDRECFLSKECDRMFVAEDVHADLGVLGLESWYQSLFAIRWVRLPDDRWALVTRTLYTEPLEFNVDWLKVEQQYGFTYAYEQDDGSIRRAQAIWAQAEIVGADVPEDFQINTAINTMHSSAAEMEAFLLAQ